MLEVAMCDDDPLFSNGLELYVKRFMQQFFPQEVTGLTWRLTRYDRLEQLLKRPTAPDLLLLDVAFSGPDDGLLAGLALRTRWPDMALLFVSSMEQYVGRGYECGALGYVIKRNMRNTFFSAMQRAMQWIQRLRRYKRRDIRVQFVINGQSCNLLADDIMYITKEKRLKKLALHLWMPDTGSKVIYYRAALVEEAERLRPYGLHKVQKSEIVNMQQVQVVEEDHLLMMDGTRVYFNPRKHSEMNLLFISTLEDDSWKRENL